MGCLMEVFGFYFFETLLLVGLLSAPIGAVESPAEPTPTSFPLPPDTRPLGCEKRIVDPAGTDFRDMKVSIIIPYRNEKWVHIRGSIDSILYYTPAELIEEILFVSDGNEPETTFEAELSAISSLIKIMVVPPPGIGLIAAKTQAVEAATAPVLAFLEPHIRANRFWLQALLARVRKHPKALAQPQFDYINQDNWNSYVMGGGGHWRFEWNLNLIFTSPSRKRSHAAYLSPATSGGIFVIRKDWWVRLGLYDGGMTGWGGDHIEATFKVWRCGGHIEIVPCARIGHVFRDPEHRPYDVPVPQVVRNYGRIAEVWLDEYIGVFYKMKPDAKAMSLGNLTEAKLLREKLQCHDMTWYLENIDQEMLWEKDRVCIPGCTVRKICCEKSAALGRTTIDRIMPSSEWRPLKLPASSRQARKVDEL